MTRKTKILIITVVLLSAVIIAFSFKTVVSDKDKMLEVESVSLHNPAGWGYEVLVDHKVFIHQENIPAIAGKKEFVTKEDAMKTAGLVVEKLVHGKKPAISKNDLDSLKISLP